MSATFHSANNGARFAFEGSRAVYLEWVREGLAVVTSFDLDRAATVDACAFFDVDAEASEVEQTRALVEFNAYTNARDYFVFVGEASARPIVADLVAPNLPGLEAIALSLMRADS